jgi:hypothetical protein
MGEADGLRHCADARRGGASCHRLGGPVAQVDLRRIRNRYSARKTFTGSRREARYAGTRLAISATSPSVAATQANVTGSDALTPKTRLFITLPDAIGDQRPDGDANERWRHRLYDDKSKHVARSRTQRSLDPDLAAAPAHDVREHAVDSDCGEQQRDSCKHSE